MINHACDLEAYWNRPFCLSNNEWADSDCEFFIFLPWSSQWPASLRLGYWIYFFFKKILLVTTVAGPVIIEICGQGPRHRPPVWRRRPSPPFVQCPWSRGSNYRILNASLFMNGDRIQTWVWVCVEKAFLSTFFCNKTNKKQSWVRVWTWLRCH